MYITSCIISRFPSLGVVRTHLPTYPGCSLSLSPSLSYSLTVSLSVWHHGCVYIASRWILPWLQCFSLPLLRPTAGPSNELEEIPCLHCLIRSAQPSVCDCIHYSWLPLRNTRTQQHITTAQWVLIASMFRGVPVNCYSHVIVASVEVLTQSRHYKWNVIHFLTSIYNPTFLKTLLFGVSMTWCSKPVS